MKTPRTSKTKVISKFKSLRSCTSFNSWIKKRINLRKSTQIQTFKSENLKPQGSWMWWENSKLCQSLCSSECLRYTLNQGSLEQEKYSLPLQIARYCNIEFSLTDRSLALLWFSTTTWSQSTTKAPIGSFTRTMTKAVKPTAVRSQTKVASLWPTK